MGVYGYLVIIAIAFVIFAVQSFTTKRNKEERMKKFLNEAFGTRPKREYKYEEYARIRFYFDSKADQNRENVIDDITWNDLSMDNIFMLLNNTHSSIGEEYLYKMLRTINFNQKDVDEFDSLSNFFLKNPDIAKKLQFIFSEMGRTKSISFFDFIHRLNELRKTSNILHYLSRQLRLLGGIL